MNNNKNNKIPKCVSLDCECDAAINKHYPDSEGGQYWTLCEKCYNADQWDITLPEECNCTPREMLGTSWWKQLGFGRPCVCAEFTRDTLINRTWETIKKEIKPTIPRTLAEHSFNIATLHNALLLNRQRRPWRRVIDAKELCDGLVECIEEFGVELTQVISPKGITCSPA